MGKNDTATFVLAFIIGLFGVPLLVMLVWNWVVVDVLSLPAIGYWQAFGLYVLSNCLFKNSSSLKQ